MMNSRILPIVVLLIAIGVFFGYVQPTWNGEIAATKAAIVSDNQALAAASQYADQQNELASAEKAIDQDDLARLFVLLPDSVDNVGLILDLNALAARSGLILAGINVTSNTESNGKASTLGGTIPVPGANSINSADLSLSAVGTYASLQTFLTGVEKSQRLLDVRDINVKGSDTGVYNFQMTLRLYWLR